VHPIHILADPAVHQAVAYAPMTAKDKTTAEQAGIFAGIVAAAFLQAKDEQKYREWREVEKQDCELSRKKTSEEFEKRVWPNGKPEWLRK
jgi:hypothetical protein